MTDTTIWIIIALVISATIGFELALVLTFGSVRKWMACGNAYKCGRCDLISDTMLASDPVMVQCPITKKCHLFG